MTGKPKFLKVAAFVLHFFALTNPLISNGQRAPEPEPDSVEENESMAPMRTSVQNYKILFGGKGQETTLTKVTEILKANTEEQIKSGKLDCTPDGLIKFQTCLETKGPHSDATSEDMCRNFVDTLDCATETMEEACKNYPLLQQIMESENLKGSLQSFLSRARCTNLPGFFTPRPNFPSQGNSGTTAPNTNSVTTTPHMTKTFASTIKPTTSRGGPALLGLVAIRIPEIFAFILIFTVKFVLFA